MYTIVNTILIGYKNINSFGLYNGKMGICMFFQEYARYTNNHFYKDIANQLINEICSHTFQEEESDIYDGYCGIGIGVIYLIKNYYQEENYNSILFDIDNHVLHESIKISLKDISLDRPVCSAGLYLLHRILYCKKPLEQKQYINCFNSLFHYFNLKRESINTNNSNMIPFYNSMNVINCVLNKKRHNYADIVQHTFDISSESLWTDYLYGVSSLSVKKEVLKQVIDNCLNEMTYDNYQDIGKIAEIGFLLLTHKIIIN